MAGGGELMSEYSFTVDWFSKHTSTWEKYLSQFKGRYIWYLEIGVFEGRSATWMFENILTNPDSRAYLVDPFEAGYGKHNLLIDFDGVRERLSSNIKQWEDRVCLYDKSSAEFFRSAPKNPRYSIIYIDGDHKAKNVLQDAVSAFEILENGGVMILDDYNWPVVVEVHNHPRTAIDAFLNIYKDDLEVLHKDDQVFIRKL